MDEQQFEASLSLLMDQMDQPAADAREIFAKLQAHLNQLRATGMPLPEDLVEMERRMGKELADRAPSAHPPAQPTVQVDNDRVRVTEWQFRPGAATGWHRHEFDYVVVPMTTGRLLARTEANDIEMELVAGQSYFRQAGVEHDIININDHEFKFVEVEVKK